jgi:hypothetical protein
LGSDVFSTNPGKEAIENHKVRAFNFLDDEVDASTSTKKRRTKELDSGSDDSGSSSDDSDDMADFIVHTSSDDDSKETDGRTVRHTKSGGDASRSRIHTQSNFLDVSSSRGNNRDQFSHPNLINKLGSGDADVISEALCRINAIQYELSYYDAELVRKLHAHLITALLRKLDHMTQKNALTGEKMPPIVMEIRQHAKKLSRLFEKVGQIRQSIIELNDESSHFLADYKASVQHTLGESSRFYANICVNPTNSLNDGEPRYREKKSADRKKQKPLKKLIEKQRCKKKRDKKRKAGKIASYIVDVDSESKKSKATGSKPTLRRPNIRSKEDAEVVCLSDEIEEFSDSPNMGKPRSSAHAENATGGALESPTHKGVGGDDQIDNYRVGSPPENKLE